MYAVDQIFCLAWTLRSSATATAAEEATSATKQLTE